MTKIVADHVRRTVTTRVVEFTLPKGSRHVLRTSSMRRFLAIPAHAGYIECRTENLARAESVARRIGGFVVDTWTGQVDQW